MSDAESLLAAVLDGPADDLPRLAFADWLEERGDRDSLARAEFVRVQVELATLAEPEHLAISDGTHTTPRRACRACRDVRPARCRYHALRWREAELLAAETLAAPGCSVLADRPSLFPAAVWGFRRGFVAHVELVASLWPAHGPALCAAHPVELVTLRNLTLAGADRAAGGDRVTALKFVAPGLPGLVAPEGDFPQQVTWQSAGGRGVHFGPVGTAFDSLTFDADRGDLSLPGGVAVEVTAGRRWR